MGGETPIGKYFEGPFEVENWTYMCIYMYLYIYIYICIYVFDKITESRGIKVTDDNHDHGLIKITRTSKIIITYTNGFDKKSLITQYIN